ncbi:MAG: porin family protein [Bacteroidia bacterium]
MKKTCSLFSLFFVLFILPGWKASAQSCEAGFELGPGVATMRGNFWVESLNAPRIGFSGGVFIQRNMPGIISFRTALLFDRKGSSFTVPVTDDEGNSLGDMRTTFNHDFLTVPLLVRATFGQKVRFFVNTGPYFSYLLKQSIVSKGDQIKTMKQTDTDGYKRFDMGISAGIGLAVPLCSTMKLNVEVRNNLGLVDVSDRPIANNGMLKHNSANLLVGVSFLLK